MNNMQKAFKTKSKLRFMADGGAVDPKTQLGVLGGPKDVGPGAGAKGTEPIFKSTVGGVPTFTDAFGKTAGAQAYTQNAAQPMGNFATNQNGRTVTPDAPVSQSALATRQTSPLADAGRSALGLAQQLPVVGPMISAGKAALGAAQNLPAPSAMPMPAAAKLSPAAAPATDSSMHKPAAAPSAGLSPALAASPLRVQSPYEKMTGQAAGSTTAAPTRPSWVQGPTPKPGAGMDYFGPNSSALNYTNAAPTPPVPAAPKIFPPYGMDANLFPAKPDEVAQLAAGGHVRGPGGPREDKIPAMLSDGEYVLPADTVEAVGKENLDALRAQTHKFTGSSKTNRMGLRKFAQGGPFDASDLNDELDRTAPKKLPGKGMMPYVEKPLVPTTAVAAESAAAPAAVSGLRAAAGFAGRALPIAGAVLGAKGLYDELQPGGQFEGMMSRPENPVKVRFPDGTRMENAAGDGQTPQWQYPNASKAMPEPAKVSPLVVPEAAKLSVAPQQAAAAAPTQELNPLQQEALAGARSTMNRADNRSFGGQVNSNAREVNRRFDDLAERLSGMYSAKGQGNLAKHLVELEQARAAALGQDTRTQADVLNNNTSATSALRGQRAQQQASALGNLAGLGNSQAASASNALSAQARVDAAQIAAAQRQQNAMMKAQLNALKYDDKMSESALNDVRGAITARFGDDQQAAQDATSRIMSAGAEQIGNITKLKGQDRAAAIEDLLDSSQLAGQMDSNTTQLYGAQKDSGLPRITEVRDPRFFEDWKTRGVLDALGAEAKDFLPFVESRVAVDDNGRAMPNPKDSRLRRRIDRDILDAPRRRALREQSRNQ